MIGSLTGTLKHKSPTEVVLDVNGVGYAVIIPFSTYEKLGDLESRVTLVTHLHVREDALQLFGFFTEEERFFFKLLISVNGIGPKIAQGILSGISVPELRQHIANGNISALTAIPGVGKKTAERIVLELRSKIGSLSSSGTGTAAYGIAGEEIDALMALGYSTTQAREALKGVDQKIKSSGERIREALKKIGK